MDINTVGDLFWLNFSSVNVFLSLFSLALITCVAFFAKNYLKGDSNYRQFFTYCTSLTISLLLYINSSNLVHFAFFWLITNLCLCRLMLHKQTWQAARNSALLALKNYLLSFSFLLIGFVLITLDSGSIYFDVINQNIPNSYTASLGLLFIVLAALSQSAIWPFHKWLASSLNSPTPVSALMHAGIINGGGILLYKFAPVILANQFILNLIFIAGAASALVATYWKLIQSDIKRMLACSTIAQMGFMFMQIGLGIFPAAIAHLILHGLFKSYLFLSSPSVNQEKRVDFNYPPTVSSFAVAGLIGLFSAGLFCLLTGYSFTRLDTSLFLLVIALIGSTQLAINFVRKLSLGNLMIALSLGLIFACSYGLSIQLIKSVTAETLIYPQLNLIHLTVLSLFVISWMATFFLRQIKDADLFKRAYVLGLNASQPKSSTVTAYRGDYQF